jgi:hypothetical protein
MKRLGIFLLVFLTALPTFADEGDPGPIRRTVDRLAGSTALTQSPLPWRNVETIRPATEITVVTDGTPATACLFVGADSTSMTILDLSNPGMPGSIRNRLREMALTAPDNLMIVGQGRAIVDGDFEVGPDGVSVHARPVVTGAVVHRIPADEVEMILTGTRRRGSAIAVGLASAGGVVLGSGLAVGIGMSRCGDHCEGAAAAMWGVLIGVPVAAGYAAWRLTSHPAQEIIYRR